MGASTENGCKKWREIIESTRSIFKSDILHFHVISILFLFPIIFSLILYPSLYLSLFHNNQIIAIIVYTLFLILFFICGVATTTYSAIEAFYDRPITVFSSIKLIRNSFFPLLSTFIVIHIIFISIALLITLSLAFVVQILQYESDQLLYLVIFGLIILVPILIWLHVNWSLAYVITIVESKKGYETLKTSAELMKEMRWIGFGILLYFGLAILGMVVICAKNLVYDGKEWMNFFLILLIALGSVMGYILMNQYLVANVVLYMYCKEFNDQKLSSENAAVGEYVSLPLDEE